MALREEEEVVVSSGFQEYFPTEEACEKMAALSPPGPEHVSRGTGTRNDVIPMKDEAITAPGFFAKTEGCSPKEDEAPSETDQARTYLEVKQGSAVNNTSSDNLPEGENNVESVELQNSDHEEPRGQSEEVTGDKFLLFRGAGDASESCQTLEKPPKKSPRKRPAKAIPLVGVYENLTRAAAEKEPDSGEVAMKVILKWYGPKMALFMGNTGDTV
ncbi:hypothetical protein JRQ81_012172 [Phrynocephalus forsythii]|uniref:Uncharacterized protein n=1 Tax=Phrynocephalus forsythii TaxID=171643 RepID=A0A9Q0X8L1_9SAUR|nr:hypothetical protein JRQ81_012172 [Phrynocephalus forsythii]